MVSAPTTTESGWRLRMRDLCEASGLERQAIHFYIREGLLPAGRKTGRNMAYYGPVHLERLELIRRLQHERFLPLRAIKAMFDGDGSGFSPEQQRWLAEVKAHADSTLAAGADTPEPTTARGHLRSAGVAEDELLAMAEGGLLPVQRRTPDGALQVLEDDVWMIELLGELKRLGTAAGVTFSVDDLGMYERAVSGLFDEEIAVVRERFVGLDAANAATLAEDTLQLVHRFIERYHRTKIRRFFATMS